MAIMGKPVVTTRESCHEAIKDMITAAVNAAVISNWRILMAWNMMSTR